LFNSINAIKHAGEFVLDPLSNVVLPSSYPPFFRPFVGIYDIPIWHLVWGVCVRFLLVILYFFLTRIITGSSLAGVIAVAILFGVASFHVGQFNILNLRLPVGFATFEVREPLYMSFRQTALIFGLSASILFLKKRYVVSSVVLGVGAYMHPLNCLMFFLCFATTLFIYSLVGKEKSQFFRAMLKFSIPFVLILGPYVWLSGSMFSNVEPMNYPDFARFMMKNEPDDFSVLYFVGYFKVLFFLGFVLTLFSGCLHLLFVARKPLAWTGVREVFEQKDIILPLLMVPWIILLCGMAWEAFLTPYMPGFVNDFVGHLFLRRVTSISAIFYVLILAAFFANSIFALVKLGFVEILGAHGIDCIKKGVVRLRLGSADAALALVLAIFLFVYVVVVENKNIGTFKKYWSTNHVSPEYFVPASDYVYKGTSDSGLLVNSIPFASFKEICLWVKNNTPIDAAFFQPTYIKEFRLLSERQGFVAEKVGGSMALYSRKFAAIYLERFSDIHQGLTYDDLPGTVFEGGEAYAVLRKRYLSLSEADIERLKQKYPGYDYFLTETSHVLKYPILFKNQFFSLYDIR
jgi:hypothetical protein